MKKNKTREGENWIHILVIGESDLNENKTDKSVQYLVHFKYYYTAFYIKILII